jgi:hypothetical protein
MIDRQQLESILQRRFPSATLDQVAAAANAIMGLDRAESGSGHCGDEGHACCSGGHRDPSRVAPPLPVSHA